MTDSFSGAVRDAVAQRADRDGGTPRIVRVGQGDTLSAESFVGVTSLAVVYPTWWGSLPAMLLAQLVALIGPWVDGDATPSTSPLRHVKQLTVYTSHGSSRFINQLQGEPGRQLWKRTVLPLCAPGATFEWKSLYKMDRLTTAERVEFLRSV